MMTWQVYQPPQGLADLISGGMVHSALLAHTAAWGSAPAVLNVTIESHGETYLSPIRCLACLYLRVKSMVWLGQRSVFLRSEAMAPLKVCVSYPLPHIPCKPLDCVPSFCNARNTNGVSKEETIFFLTKTQAKQKMKMRFHSLVQSASPPPSRTQLG